MSTEKITSDKLMYETYVRQAIEAGLSDSLAGKTVDVTVVCERFGLPSCKTLPQNQDSELDRVSTVTR